MTNLRSEDDRCKQLSVLSLLINQQQSHGIGALPGSPWANAWVKAIFIRQAHGAQEQSLVALSLGHGLKSSSSAQNALPYGSRMPPLLGELTDRIDLSCHGQECGISQKVPQRLRKYQEQRMSCSRSWQGQVGHT